LSDVPAGRWGRRALRVFWGQVVLVAIAAVALLASITDANAIARSSAGVG
jgi:hypothetical protein